MKQALIVIDMQNGVFARRPVYRGDVLIGNIRRAILYARNHRIPVIFSLHTNDTFLSEDSEGHRLVDPLVVRDGDIVIHKTKPDIYTDTDLDTILRQRGINSLIVTGVISNGCVKQACLSALEKHYAVTLIEDAHSTFYSNGEKVIGRVNREMARAGVQVTAYDEWMFGR